MKHVIFYLVGLGCAANATLAGQAMTAQEFQAYTEGKTFLYKYQGQSYGAEEYLPGRKVRWLFVGDHCLDGEWYPDPGNNICFVYEGQPTPQCWQVVMTNGRLVAQFVGDESMDSIYEVEQSRTPLLCPGPKIGV